MENIKTSAGFTLIELMIVVALMAILSAICIPKAGEAIDRAKNATTLGNLATLRGALAMYYANTEGSYPSFPPPLNQTAGYGTLLQDTLVPIYLNKIPETLTSGQYHRASSLVGLFWNQTGQADDETNGYGSGWRYDANPHDVSVYATSGWGSIFILCNHKNAKGMSWTTY